MKSGKPTPPQQRLILYLAAEHLRRQNREQLIYLISYKSCSGSYTEAILPNTIRACERAGWIECHWERRLAEGRLTEAGWKQASTLCRLT